MRSPLRRRKSRTQPILSAGSPPSIRLSAMDGCQLGRPLKSRTPAQTRSWRALATGEPSTRAMASPSALLVHRRLTPACLRGGRLRPGITAFAYGVPDPLHVARLAHQARHLGEASALDAEIR